MAQGWNRRQILRGAGFITIGGTAGCIEGGESPEDDDDSAENNDITEESTTSEPSPSPVETTPTNDSQTEDLPSESVDEIIGINECTTINQSGHYVLTDDIGEEGAHEDSACIRIAEASDVVLEGDKYTVGHGRHGIEIVRCDNVVIRDVTCSNIDEIGIRVSDSESVEVHDNIVDDATAGVGVVHGSKNVATYGNTLKNLSASGLHIWYVEQGEIYENEVLECRKSGISMGETQEYVVEDNRFSTEGTDDEDRGIWVGNSSDITIHGNTMERFYYGVQVVHGCTNVTVSQNEVYDSDVCAMRASGSEEIVFMNNYMEDHAGLLLIGSTDINIRSNTITESRTDGIRLIENSQRIDIAHNEITSSANNGVYVVQASDISIHENNIYDNEWGVRTESTSKNVDATNNWWGDKSGPSGEGPGRGDAVSDYVVFDPWKEAKVEAGADFNP